ncbi:MAG: DNA-binding protein [Bacteroidetes bacterium RIFCSPLOWO2_02_FULL_36_8]|nr:MAG: DNA-binding protein [Bacteroidetes bacterium RIFCSPLOWO2_02_FULL_36_8]OFY69832.1 MAG: DNA-binding protein [Bacteroidetes bacterium RIFCSPLOWO2_12_FULL_37_12]
MALPIKFEDVEKKIIGIRNQYIILDSDVAELYAVSTKEINQAVKNNPEKFPEGYIFEITKDELVILRSKFLTTKFSKTRVLPKAFTKKGLYMLATIIKSPDATQTTLNIVETYDRIENLKSNIHKLSSEKDKQKKNALLKKSGEIITEILDDNLKTNESETTIELNFAVLRFKHTIKRKK